MDEEERERRMFQLDLHIGRFFQSFMITFISIFFSAFISLLIASLMTGNIHFQTLLNLYGLFAVILAILLYILGLKNIEKIKKLYIHTPESSDVEPLRARARGELNKYQQEWEE